MRFMLIDSARPAKQLGVKLEDAELSEIPTYHFTRTFGQRAWSL